MNQLQRLGFSSLRTEALEALGDPTLVPARVAVEHRGGYGLLGCEASAAQLSGRLRHLVEGGGVSPCVGDWVAVRPAGDLAVIETVLPRTSLLSRRRPGVAAQAQAVAANVDVVFVVSSANRDFNPRRIERYLATVYASGARPVIVLSKADLAGALTAQREALAAIAPAVPVVVTSTTTGLGIDELRAELAAGSTGALVGSSGVGKSSLLNALLGEARQNTREIRAADDKGRHATTRRELVELGEGCLVDTPGMREVGLWDAAEGTTRAFEEIDRLTAACRFRDCQHRNEPGCAVRAAVEAGELGSDRLASYERLRREQEHLDRREDVQAQGRQKQRWKSIHKQQRARRQVDPKLRSD